MSSFENHQAKYMKNDEGGMDNRTWPEKLAEFILPQPIIDFAHAQAARRMEAKIGKGGDGSLDFPDIYSENKRADSYGGLTENKRAGDASSDWNQLADLYGAGLSENKIASHSTSSWNKRADSYGGLTDDYKVAGDYSSSWNKRADSYRGDSYANLAENHLASSGIHVTKGYGLHNGSYSENNRTHLAKSSGGMQDNSIDWSGYGSGLREIT